MLNRVRGRKGGEAFVSTAIDIVDFSSTCPNSSKAIAEVKAVVRTSLRAIYNFDWTNVQLVDLRSKTNSVPFQCVHILLHQDLDRSIANIPVLDLFSHSRQTDL